MRITRYQKFLSSPFWKNIRNRYWSKLNTDKKCFVCRSENDLQLHHRSYRKLYKNTTNNLVLLCSSCHKSVHFKKGVRTNAPIKLRAYKNLRKSFVSI